MTECLKHFKKKKMVQESLSKAIMRPSVTGLHFAASFSFLKSILGMHLFLVCLFNRRIDPEYYFFLILQK